MKEPIFRRLVKARTMENNRNVKALRRDFGQLAVWELILLAVVLVTFFGLLDHTKDKEYQFTRTSYQTKVDLYDLRIEENSKSVNDRVETGL
jgi:hypothetical protein